ncbi:acyl-protein synthetase [Clostridium acetobutylicum]|nr:acyl-protein synthetase [Clostridium acetobutylicum]
MEYSNFFDDLKSNIIGQYEECKAYRILCESQGYNPSEHLRSEKDITNIPFLATTLFKKSANLFLSLLRVEPDKLDKWTLSSSTSGDPSMVGRRNSDLMQIRKFVLMDDKFYDSASEYNCVFYPEPKVMREYKSVRIMDKPTESYIGNLLGIFDFSENTTFLLKSCGEGFSVDMNSFEEFLKFNHERNNHLSLRGSTLLLYNAVLELKKQGKGPYNLGSRAIVHTGGGGWDGKKGNISIGTKIERYQFVEEISEFLGIPQKNFRDTYSFTENTFPMDGHYSQKLRSYLFHVPTWGRVIIRDVKTLEPLNKPGDRGLVQVLNAYGTSSFAGASILVDDIAEIVANDFCPECKHEGMTFKIVGRVKGSEAKGCGATLDVRGKQK